MLRLLYDSFLLMSPRSPTMKTRTIMLAMATMLMAAPVFAEGVPMQEEKPGLLKKAKVTADAATAAAQAKVPKGKIASAEIEEENGKLIYSFDIKTEGKSGVDEVNVDGITGKVTVQHETPRDEAKEKAAEKKK
jgi:hypothetical protein